MGMETDRLDIAIEAQASGASRELTTLYEQLNKVSSALGGSASAYRSSAREIGRVAAAVRSLSSIRMPDFSKLITQLQALAGINLNSLKSKKIDIDISLTGRAGTQGISAAVEDVIENAKFDTSPIADRLLNAFHIDNKKAAAQVKATVDSILAEIINNYSKGMAESVEAAKPMTDALQEIIKENGRVIQDGLEEETRQYLEFLKFMEDNPMKVSAVDVGKSEWAEMRGEFLRYFNSSSGVSTDNGFLGTLHENFSNLFSILDVMDLTTPADQVNFILQRLREAREVAAGITISALSGEDLQGATSQVANAVADATVGLFDAAESAVEKSIQANKDKIILDVGIDEEKFQRDISNAIKRASQVKYDPIKLTLDIDNKNIKNTVKENVANMDAGTVPEIANAYESIVRSMQNLKTVAGNKEIEKIVGSMQKLAKTDMSKFDSQSFTVIADTFERIAKIPDVSATVNRLVSTITRLAKSGDQMRAATAELPAFASGLEQAMKAINASGGATGDTVAILEAFTKIATAGDKISTSAAGIPAATSAIVDFLNAMSTAPEVSAGTQSLVASFAAIATAGKRVGNVGDQVSRAYNSMANSGARSAAASRVAAGAFAALKTALSGLEKAAKTALTAMEKIAKACLNVGTAVFNPIGALKKFGSSIQAVGNRIGITTPKIDRATFSFRNLLRAIVPFYGIRSIFNWGKEATELASDLTEVQNVVENSFGTKGTEMVENFADSAIENFGMTELTAKQIASRYQAMGNAMGITTGQIAKANENMADRMIDSYKEVGDGMGNMSVRLTMLAADMASFYNVEQETVAEALNAVYTGQTRPLRQYGIDLTQATLQEWANKQGIDAKISSMSQAEKTMLRYQYVIASTSTIQGDFARTSMTWANQVRMLRQNLQALAAVVGNTLVNAFRPLVVWLNTAMSSVISFAETVGNALGKIFGWQIMHTPASNAADVYDTLTESLGGTEDAGDGAADGLGKAAKAAEEYKNTVLGFDELNKLNGVDENSGSPSSGGGGGGAGSPGGGVVDGTGADFRLVKSDTWFEAYKSDIDNLEELGEYIGQALKKAMERIKWKEIYEKARGFGTGLADFLNGLFKDPTVFGTLGSTIASAINTVLNAKDAFLDRFNFTNLGKSIAAAINGFFNTYDFDLKAKNFYKLINGIIKAIKAAADDIEWKGIGTKISGCVKQALQGISWRDAYDAANSFGSGLASFLNGLINPETFGEIGKTVASALNVSLRFLNTFGSTFSWSGLGSSIASAISNFFKTWNPSLTASTFTTFASGILTAIRSAIEGVSWETVGAKMAQLLKDIDWALLLTETGKAIMAGINGALTAAESFFDGTPVSNAISTLKETINDIAEKIDFKTLSDGFKDIAEACAPFVEGFADGLVEAFSELAKIGVAVLRGIGVAFRVIANAIKSLPKGLVKDFGYGLGIVAAAMVTINGLDKVSGIIKGVVGTFKCLGGAAASGSTIAGSIGEIGTKSGTVKTAVMGLFKELGKSFGFMEGAGVIAATELGKGLQLLDEKTRGENGELSEMGGIMDTIATDFAPGTAESIRKLKDDLENNKVTTDEASTAFANFFTGQHITPEKVEEALIRASGQMNVTDEQAKLLEQTVQKMGEQMDSTADTVNMTEEDYNSFKTVLQYLQRECGLTQSAYDDIDQTMKNSVGSTTATQAYELFRAKLSEVGIESDTYKDKMTGIGTTNETTKGKVNLLKEAFTQLSTVAKQKIIDMSSSATVSYGNVKTALSNVSSQLGLTNDDISLLETTLYEQELSGATAEQAYNAVKNTLKKLTTNSDEAAKALDQELDVALNNSKNSASDADGKISAMKSDLWKFAIGAGAKMILLAVVNTAFQGFATDAEDAGTSITTMQEDGSAALSTLGDDAEAAATKIGNALSMKDYDMWTMGYNVAQNLSNGMDAGLLLPKIGATWERWTYGNGGWFDLPSFSLSWFAKGGFPNMGQLFMANEAGPEMVGKMGRRNVVANNMQITEGIREAVVDGMMEVAMATSNGDGSDEVPYVINMRVVTDDDETLARRVERGRMKRDARYNPTPAYV